MNRREFNTALIAGGTLLATPHVARSNTVYNLKLGHFISPTHIFAKYLEARTVEMKEKSGGRLVITIFPASEMGPVQNYADYARTARNLVSPAPAKRQQTAFNRVWHGRAAGNDRN